MLVAGGGLTGALCANRLAERGLEVTVWEQARGAGAKLLRRTFRAKEQREVTGGVFCARYYFETERVPFSRAGGRLSTTRWAPDVGGPELRANLGAQHLHAERHSALS